MVTLKVNDLYCDAAPDYVETPTLAHGRIETRRIWCSTALNDYLDFPHVGQTFVIERAFPPAELAQAQHLRYS